MRAVCILDLDSPSYPSTTEEYQQCGCKDCLQYLDSIVDDDKSFERDMCQKYPFEENEP